MQPAQAKPRRKRRRWLIVALLLVLAGVAWWNWPRGDARFVGKWRVITVGALGLFMDTDRTSLEPSRWSSFKAGQVVDLREDGTAHLGEGPFREMPLVWKASQGHLKFVPNQLQMNVVPLWRRLQFGWEHATDRDYHAGNAWPIESISQDELRLRPTITGLPDANVVILRRVEE